MSVNKLANIISPQHDGIKCFGLPLNKNIQQSILNLPEAVFHSLLKILILEIKRIIYLATYDENDLVDNDYENTTTNGDDPQYIAVKDRERVNKKELYEVVYFCNSFLANHNLTKKGTFQMVEKLLRHPEASKIVTRGYLNAFFVNNWNKNLV